MKNFKEMVYKNLFEVKTPKYDPEMEKRFSKKQAKNLPDELQKSMLGLEEEVEITEELFEEESPEQTKPSLEEAAKTILDEEGGAADLKKIDEKLRDKNMEVPMDLEQRLADMKNVMKHSKGDYIEMSGLKDQNPNMMLPEE